MAHVCQWRLITMKTWLKQAVATSNFGQLSVGSEFLSDYRFIATLRNDITFPVESTEPPIAKLASPCTGVRMKKSQVAPQFPDPAHDHQPCLADTLRRAETIYEKLGMRLTPLRKQVLSEVAGSHTAVGAYDVLDRLSRQSGRRLAPISVYRALDSLVEAGLVHRLESRNAFFACHAQHAANLRQIVLACERCSTVAEIAGDDVFDEIGRLAAATGFIPGRALIEISGRCGDCSKVPS